MMRLGRCALNAAMIGACLSSIPASAQGGLQDQLAACARIAKKNARVECYDALARASGDAAPIAPAAPSAIGTPRAAPLPLPPSPPARTTGFGAEQIARPVAVRERAESALDGVVISARDNGIGMWTVTLADGAAWRMTERATDFRPPRAQEQVTIRKGALGSYLMQVGKQAAVRVNRVR